MPIDLKPGMARSVFAFRGYNVTNLGRTPELLEHPTYGPVIERHLKDVSEIYTSATMKRVDLVKRVRNREETTLETYGEAVAMIVAVELAQIEILEQQFDIPITRARSVLGYSLGEVAALVATGVYSLDALLVPILSLSDDCV